MKGRFPVYVISISIPPENVDVNVHPSKREVKFENPNMVYGIIRRAVEKALLSVDHIQTFLGRDKIVSKESNDLFAEEFMYANIQENKDDFLSLVNEKKPEVKPEVENDDNTKIPEYEGQSFKIGSSLNGEVKEVELDVSQHSNVKDKDIEDLENMSLKDKVITSKNNSVFFFDQNGEKFYRAIETESENFLKASVKDQMIILGTLFKTYIVIEYKDSVYFIDQHAAHERLLYDKLVKGADENTQAKQQLLAPYTFSVGAKESQSLDLIMPNLEKIGFEINKNGYSYTIQSLPYILSYINLSSFVDELVAESLNLESKPSDFIHSKLCQSACKHAIKAGDTIGKDECAYIIEEVRKGVMLCHHGRPITLVMTKHDFEKMFKRIV